MVTYDPCQFVILTGVLVLFRPMLNIVLKFLVSYPIAREPASFRQYNNNVVRRGVVLFIGPK